VKFHAAMAALHGTIGRCLFAPEKNGQRNSRISARSRAFEARVSKAAFEHGGWIAPADKPISSVAAQMSIQYAAACQCIDGQVLMAQFRPRQAQPSWVDQSDAKGHADSRRGGLGDEGQDYV